MSSVRTRSRRGEGDRLRDEILAAVGALLDETKDEAAVSIRAIAERVGVSPPSIYRHFEDKEALLRSDPEVFFTTPHYDGYAYVLVRLDRIGRDQLAELVEDAWRLRAPKSLLG